MKTILADLSQCGIPQFRFAGFAFPKHVWTLPRGKLAKRLARRKANNECSDYYHAPRPNSSNTERGFYLDSDGQGFERWEWADDVISLRHTGWYTDEYCEDKMRGIVVRLNRGRGFLAGWSMGEGMASTVDTGTVFDDVRDAALCADSMAENAAEREREYQQRERERMDAEEADESLSQSEEEYRTV